MGMKARIRKVAKYKTKRIAHLRFNALDDEVSLAATGAFVISELHKRYGRVLASPNMICVRYRE
jgi:hypothetical protein